MALTLEEAERKIADAYQVIGALCAALGYWDDVEQVPSKDEMTRALDYFALNEEFDESFLPWPRQEPVEP